MTGKEKLEKYAEAQKEQFDGERPVYELLLFSEPDKEMVSKDGKKLGFPDMGATMSPGFFHNLDDAIQAMNMNEADIRECLYRAGFVLCRFPGLYEAVGESGRIFFLWDDEREGFFETEEPKIFEHMAL